MSLLNRWEVQFRGGGWATALTMMLQVWGVGRYGRENKSAKVCSLVFVDVVFSEMKWKEFQKNYLAV